MNKLCFMCIHRLQEDQLHHARATIALSFMHLERIKEGKETAENVHEWLKSRADDINEHSQKRVLAGCDHTGYRES